MTKKIVNIKQEDFFLHNANDAKMPKTTSRANLELSFALVEDTSDEILGWVLLTLSNLGALQVAESREDDKKRLETLQTQQGCQLLEFWAKNKMVRAKLINDAIPVQINAWNAKYNQKIAYYFMDVVADNSVIATEIDLDATGSFEYLEDAYTKKTIVYHLLNS